MIWIYLSNVPKIQSIYEISRIQGWVRKTINCLYQVASMYQGGKYLYGEFKSYIVQEEKVSHMSFLETP